MKDDNSKLTRKRMFMEEASMRAMQTMVANRGRNKDTANECIRWAEDVWNALIAHEEKDNGHDTTDRREQ